MSCQEIKYLIRDWFATLSIEEIASNNKLARLFKMIEDQLRYLEARS